MQGLSKDIEAALDVVIEGLDFNFIIKEIDPDRIKTSMESKISAFNTAKKMLYKWQNSPNAPTKAKFNRYVQSLIESGEKSLRTLRRALKAKIKYNELEANKHKSAVDSKLHVLNFITELNSSVEELRHQFESGKVVLKEFEFKRGWAEKFANQEFYPEKDYHKVKYNEEEDAVMICPKGTKGEIIVLDDLRIQLPSVPNDRSKILHYKKPKEEQYWKREPMPKGLTPENSEEYTDYILEQFRLRREGLWIYINGKPTYIPGRFWFQLQWGKMLDDAIYPDFREAQLMLAYHKTAVWLSSDYLGQIFLKSRQTGFTYGIVSDAVEVGTSTCNIKCGLTSMTAEDSELAFGKQSYLFLELPFFFQPIVKGKVDSTSKIVFGKPSDGTKEAKKRKDTSTEGYLNTSLLWQATKAKAFDGQKLKIYIGDECSKWDRVSYIEHFNTLLPTMFRGGRISGKCFLGSTFGKLSEGGEDFKTLYLNSKVKDKLETGHTPTRLASYFMPAHKNFEQCVDRYGKCWEITPPKGTLNAFGEPITKGSIELIEEMYEAARKQGDIALNAIYRAYPMTESHAFRDEAESCVFNLTKLQDQLDYNSKFSSEDLYTVGNFEWKNGVRFSEVVFYPMANGRFNVSWMPNAGDGTLHLKNNVRKDRNLYHPLNDFGCIGVDCYGSYTIGKNKASKGAAHAFTATNGYGVPSNACLFEYLAKPPTQDIFNEDILKAAWFYGLPILAENNRRDFVRYIYLNQCRPFSMSRVDKPLNKLVGDDKVLAGQPMQNQDILDSHQNAIKTYIQNYVGESTDSLYRPEGEMGVFIFSETIKDWMKFNPTKRTAHDLTISSGLAIMGCHKERYRQKPKKADSKKYVSLIRKYSNNGDIGSYKQH
jgi:hypothetical protein